MSDYMVKMGAKPETHEEHLHKTIGELLMTIRFLMRNENDKAKEWMYNLVLPSLENVYKEQDSKYIKDFFTEDEWDAIYSAMADYQDHGQDETEIAYQIQSKITALFNGN